MNWKLTELGAEPRKLAILGVLVVAAGYFFLSNRTPEESSAPPSRTAQPAISQEPATVARPATRNARQARNGGNRNLKEFRPSLKAKDMDRSTIDPTLRLDLLAKLESVPVEGGGRSLFEFGKEPPPAPVSVKEPEPIKPKYAFVGPPAPPKPVEVKPPPPPQAPPVPLKYYGFVNPQQTPGPKRAFFLDGEDIIVAAEGDLVKKRYKIVRIGVNSAVVQDTQFEKAQNKDQTLPLVEEQAG
jgi:hypothetical protein